MERRRTAAGKTVFHLLNYNNSAAEASDIVLTLKNMDGPLKMHSPGEVTRDILPENNRYCLPDFRTWAILETTEETLHA